MTDHPAKSNAAWMMMAGSGVAALLLFAAVMGFVVTPLSQARGLGLSPWAAICRAAGLTREPAVDPKGARAVGAAPVSAVVYDPGLMERLARADRREGARLVSQTCSVCHGEYGVSANPAFPSLADQSTAAIYKQLSDYKTGARTNSAMSAVVLPMTDTQMLDVAAYLSHDDGFGGLGPRWPVPEPAAVALVRKGDSARNLPACEACHGANAGGPIETPRLYGQQEEYLLAQLQAYARGGRRNDVYGRMRNIANKLTPEEMVQVSTYYQGLR